MPPRNSSEPFRLEERDHEVDEQARGKRRADHVEHGHRRIPRGIQTRLHNETNPHDKMKSSAVKVGKKRSISGVRTYRRTKELQYARNPSMVTPTKVPTATVFFRLWLLPFF